MFSFKKIVNTRLKKVVVIVVSVVILVVALIIAFISPITKYLVEKHSVKYTGRQITMNWAYVNPFTGYLHFSKLKIYEENSDSIALSVGSLSGTFDVGKLFSGKYIISELILDHPLWYVIKNKNDFNFTSFLKHLAPEHPDTTNKPSSFNIINVKIKEGEFHYLQQGPPVTYYIKGANFESDGKLFDADSVVFKFFFLSGPGTGSIGGNFTVNFKTLDYHYNVIVKQFDIQPIEQYIDPFINYGTFTASLDADLKSVGNFSDGEDVTTRGRLDINDFHFGRTRKEDYLSFDKLTFAIDELSPKKKQYLFDSLSLKHLYFKYEQFDRLDNIQTMFGEKGANVTAVSSDDEHFNLVLEIARYVKILANNFFHSYYKINRLGIYNTDLQYNDFSLNEKFALDLDPLYITADSIDKNHNRVDINFKSGLEPFGNASASVSINPRDTGDFDLKYRFQKLPVSVFNPYLISYTSFPLDRGTIELNGTWNVRNGLIQSVNHLVIIDPRVTKKIKKKDNKWIPMPLVMSFIREKGNVIDYEIPITGNLKNPKFHLHDVLVNLLKNIFVKPVTTPYRMEVRNVENEIEKSLTLKWAMRQNVLKPNQEKFVEKIGDFLAKNPDAFITIHPQEYAFKEKEYILFFEAKKKYFLLSKDKNDKVLTEDDSEKIDKMSIRDSSFLRYINKQNTDSMLFTIQEKCSKLVGGSVVNAKFKQLNMERENTFLAYFKKKAVDKQVKIYAGEHIIPYNGFSFYKIEYKGQMPESLSLAYQQMNELNEKEPRKKFEPERKRDKAPVYEIKAK